MTSSLFNTCLHAGLSMRGRSQKQNIFVAGKNDIQKFLVIKQRNLSEKESESE